MSWTQKEAVALCAHIETICPANGCHVALTGGCLYKPDPRDDCDILFYRIRQVNEINHKGLYSDLEKHLRMVLIKDCGWCVKFEWGLKQIDAFFPEADSHTNSISQQSDYE